MPLVSPSRTTKSNHPSRAGLDAGLVRAFILSLCLSLCVSLGRGAAAPADRRGEAFAAAGGGAPDVSGVPEVASAGRDSGNGAIERTEGGRRRKGAAAVSRFAVAPGAREELRALWDASVRENEERVACLGGERDGDGVVRITRIYPLLPASADSANAGAGPSLSTCRPPRWFGTVHTHIITSPNGEPYVSFSTPDRDVIARWQEAWRADGVFCLLFSEEDAHCEAGPRASADVSYGTREPATYSVQR